MSTMQVVGFYDTDENYRDSATGPIDVTERFGCLYCEDNVCWAVRDQYNDWVNPTLLDLGLKARVEILEREGD